MGIAALVAFIPGILCWGINHVPWTYSPWRVNQVLDLADQKSSRGRLWDRLNFIAIDTTEVNSFLSSVKYFDTIWVNQPALQKILKRSYKLTSDLEKGFAFKKETGRRWISYLSAVTVMLKIIMIWDSKYLNICKEKFSVKYMNSGFTLFSVNTEVGIGSSLFFFSSINKDKSYLIQSKGFTIDCR